MDLDLEGKLKVKFSMIPYVEEIINNFLEGVEMSTTFTPVEEHLFWIWDQEKTKQLPEEQSIKFHHNVAKL